MRLKRLDSRLRGNDTKQRFPTFYEIVQLDIKIRIMIEFHINDVNEAGGSSLTMFRHKRA